MYIPPAPSGTETAEADPTTRCLAAAFARKESEWRERCVRTEFGAAANAAEHNAADNRTNARTPRVAARMGQSSEGRRGSASWKGRRSLVRGPPVRNRKIGPCVASPIPAGARAQRPRAPPPGCVLASSPHDLRHRLG